MISYCCLQTYKATAEVTLKYTNSMKNAFPLSHPSNIIYIQTAEDPILLKVRSNLKPQNIY